MFSSSTIFKAIPSFWRDRFEDKDLLDSLYSFIGDYLGDALEEIYKPLAAQSLVATPLTTFKTWSPLYLSDIARLTIQATSDEGTSIIVYGIQEIGYILDSCSRLYSYPRLGANYLNVTDDFNLYDRESKEIEDLIALSGNPNFFDRYSRFLVLYSIDPIESFASKEPEEPLAIYPLVFKVNTFLLEGQTEAALVAKEITVTHNYVATSTNLLAAIDEGEYTLLLLEPSCFNYKIDDGIVTFEGLVDTPIVSSVDSAYTVGVRDSVIWAYDCAIDKLELFRRWGHLLQYNAHLFRPIRSTPRYKKVLEGMLEARLLGLSADRLSKLSSLLGGSDQIDIGNLRDDIVTIDLVNNTVATFLTQYSLLPNAVVNSNVVRAAQFIRNAQGSTPIVGCALVKLEDITAYRLIVRHFAERGSESLEVRDSQNTLLGSILLTCDLQTVLVKRASSATVLAGRLKIFLNNTNYLSVIEQDYSYEVIEKSTLVTPGTIINPLVEVYDYSTGLETLVDEGITIPDTIWKISEGSRRVISTNLTPFTIGQMPLHRIGDYELVIPTQDQSVTYFDQVSELNPSGLAWPTSYKLFKHFLLTKLAVLIPINESLSSDIATAMNRLDSAIDITKKLVVSSSSSLVEFIPAATDSLEVTVQTAPLQNNLQVNSYEGINSLGPLLLIDLPSDLPNPEQITRILFDVTQDYIPVTLRGAGSRKVLVEATSEHDLLFSNQEQGNSLQLEVNSVLVQTSGISVATNYIGAPSKLMVVGGSYPEYTSYYEFEPNTVSEWLQLEVEEPGPPGPIEQNLSDNIESPTDNLPDPEVN